MERNKGNYYWGPESRQLASKKPIIQTKSKLHTTISNKPSNVIIKINKNRTIEENPNEHKDIDDNDIDKTISAFRRILGC